MVDQSMLLQLDFHLHTSYFRDNLSNFFKIVELDEVVHQKEHTFSIDVLNKIRVSDVNNNIVKVLKSRFVNLNEYNYPEQALHIFAENGRVPPHNLVMLNKTPGDLVVNHAIDTIST